MLPTFPAPNQLIQMPLLVQRGIKLTIKRLDQIHPEVSGNKWFKLKYNLDEAKKQGQGQLLTFGGAYSNHLYATAAAAKYEGMKSVGVIRGDEVLPLNPTLSYSKVAGMDLHFLSRQDYRKKTSEAILSQLKEKFGDFYLIPEGGTNAPAIKGTREILGDTDGESDYICTSVGTGGTMVGILSSANASQKVLGFSSLKGSFIHEELNSLLQTHQITPCCGYEILDRYHFGGYAKFTPELINFIHSFKSLTGIPLDPVYTGKMMYGLIDLIHKGDFPKGTKILAIHSGGLQGISGFNIRHGTQLPDF